MVAAVACAPASFCGIGSAMTNEMTENSAAQRMILVCMMAEILLVRDSRVYGN